MARGAAKRSPTRTIHRRARREDDKQALRDKILRVARQEFANQSAESVSIQKIADAVGYSKATILKYFPSKIALLVFVKETNLREVVELLEQIIVSEPDPIKRLRAITLEYIAYWLANPDHFKSLFSMAGTREDRRLTNGLYFGQTPIARRAFAIFVECTDALLCASGAHPAQGVSNKLATLLLSAAHGVISLPLGTPTMNWQDVSSNGPMLIDSLLRAWLQALEIAKHSTSWPEVTTASLIRSLEHPRMETDLKSSVAVE